MNAYTVSRLAHDAGVSAHIVRAAVEAGIGLDLLPNTSVFLRIGVL